MNGEAVPTGDVHDFDFLIGAWTVAHRRLKARLVGCREWEEFPGTSRCEKLLGGLVNVDENVFPTKELAGMTVRAFNLARRRWAIYWVSSERGVLTPPVMGGFADDEGRFYGDDLENGKLVKVVFRWTRHGPDAARWEQAFSLEGREWEWNWVMDFTRVAS